VPFSTGLTAKPRPAGEDRRPERRQCEGDAARLHALRVRFTAPVYPGETLRTEIWREPGRVAFRMRALDRDVVVLDNGDAEVTP